MKIFYLILAFLSKHMIMIHKGTIISKMKSVLVLSLTTSIPIKVSEFLMQVSDLGIVEIFNFWIDENGGYIFFVTLAIIIDHALGSAVHFYKRDFSIRKNITGILLKLFLVFSLGVLFEGFQFIFKTENFITDYLQLITRLMVFLYPAGSAFMNCAILTKGKFPPIGWIQKISKFNSNLDLREFKNDGHGRPRRHYQNEDQDEIEDRNDS